MIELQSDRLALGNIRYSLRNSAEFKESEHPRAADGKFGSGGSKSNPEKKEAKEISKQEGTELSEKQKKQINTPEFKKWFGKSKVVDEDGNPKKIFHGSYDFKGDSFNKESLGKNTGARSAQEGFFFADYDIASSYTTFDIIYKKETGKELPKEELWDFLGPQEKDTRNPVLLECFLSLQNPIVHDFKGESYRDESYANLLIKAKEDGYDGAIFLNTSDSYLPSMKNNFGSVYVAFESEQIKSATDNDGSFDPDSDKITNSAKKVMVYHHA